MGQEGVQEPDPRDIETKKKHLIIFSHKICFPPYFQNLCCPFCLTMLEIPFLCTCLQYTQKGKAVFFCDEQLNFVLLGNSLMLKKYV